MEEAIDTEEISIADFMGETPEGNDRPELQSDPDRDSETESETLKTRIAGYYINKQLEESILSFGKIPDNMSETRIGVGFLDIVDYSYISSWLSPRENQVFLNGLYTAFHLVLKKRGGFLNKISGDSLMFHFGGLIDPTTCGLPPDQAEPLIARLLFLTCIEVQECCRLFNKADERFVPATAEPGARKAMNQAFNIIRNLRENLSAVSSINSMFQVRIRIGAAMGEVCIGNFGPEGARQWDIIGVPVIEARRMESTAPVDGIRISKSLMDVLESTGIRKQYLESFRSRASGYYRGISLDELFNHRPVILQDKRNASFESCAIQANPDLPEDVRTEVESFLEREEGGPEGIIGLLKYYRGNRHVIRSIGVLFRERGIAIDKADIYTLLLPRKFDEMVREKGDPGIVRKDLDRRLSLFSLFQILGRFQDELKPKPAREEEFGDFATKGEWIARRMETIEERYRGSRKHREHRRYFEEVLFPGTFLSIEASIREYLWKCKSESI